MKTPSPSTHQPVHGRHDRLLKERVHDPYKARLKPEGPALCESCGVVFQEGRWQWLAAPEGCSKCLCPACQRIQDKLPAGYLGVSGEFAREHQDEVMNLIHHVEQKEGKEHPLHRIMAIEPQADGMLVTFTDAHLARGVGEALHSAYKGELDFSYAEEEQLLRGTWRR